MNWWSPRGRATASSWQKKPCWPASAQLSQPAEMGPTGMFNDWVFANNSAVGLEPVVTIYNIRMVRLRGIIRYIVAALRAINQKPAWNMSLEWDNGSYEGPRRL